MLLHVSLTTDNKKTYIYGVSSCNIQSGTTITKNKISCLGIQKTQVTLPGVNN